MEKTNKIRVEEITLRRAEGRIGKDSFDPTTVKTYEDADALLRRWAETAPSGGGYHKTDFRVLFEDGETYEGRYDLTREDATRADLRGHMRDHVRFVAGLWRSHLSEDEYRGLLRQYEQTEPGISARHREFLERYEF
jgi:hypothetical protein